MRALKFESPKIQICYIIHENLFYRCSLYKTYECHASAKIIIAENQLVPSIEHNDHDVSAYRAYDYDRRNALLDECAKNPEIGTKSTFNNLSLIHI